MSGLPRADWKFGHPALSRMDFKQVEMDRVLTGFLARLRHKGLPSRLLRGKELDVNAFSGFLLDEENLAYFRGFEPDTTRRWVQTHLLDLVNRGKETEAVAGPRPLHGFTYHYRNARRSRTYGADEQLYEMLRHEPSGRGRRALDALTEFFFPGVDPLTWSADAGAEVDVETQALLNLTKSQRPEDIPDTGRAPEPHPPLLPQHGELLADDVLRLLRHRSLMPRTVLIDAMKTLFAIHLARYHIELIQLLPKQLAAALEGRPLPVNAGPALLVDVTDTGPHGQVAALAGRSAAGIINDVPAYIRAAFGVRALGDFAAYLVRHREIRRPHNNFFTVEQLLALASPERTSQRTIFFRERIDRIAGELDEAGQSQLDSIMDLELDSFSAYLEVVMLHRVNHHRTYLVQCLDTLLLKNRPGALIAQPHRGIRRFVIDNHLLETLIQIIMLQQNDNGAYTTAPMRVDQLLTVLRQRYGLHIDRLPNGLLDAEPTPAHQAALRINTASFVRRLREIGYYQERSDAYLTQAVTPRYRINDNAGSGR